MKGNIMAIRVHRSDEWFEGTPKELEAPEYQGRSGAWVVTYDGYLPVGALVFVKGRRIPEGLYEVLSLCDAKGGRYTQIGVLHKRCDVNRRLTSRRKATA